MMNSKDQCKDPLSACAGTVSFKELAMSYYPNLVPASASRSLRRDIAEYPKLRKELEENGWQLSRRILYPKQVNIIVKYLGMAI